MKRVLLGIAAALAAALTAAAQTPAAMTLADFERLALEHHPAAAQAEARIRAAEGQRVQAGLYPNPFFGVTNDDLSFGPVIRGGEWGVVVEQDIVLGGKLGLGRQAASEDVRRAQSLAEATRIGVLNRVRQLFYRTLAVQHRVEVRQGLLALVQDAVATSRQLQNVGQADLPDVLAIEIEEHGAALALAAAQNELDADWTQLTAAAGVPDMERVPLIGDLEPVPELDQAPILEQLLAESPEPTAARAAAARNAVLARRAQRQPIPDLNIRAGVHYNRELLEAGGRPIGTQGSLEVGVRVPLFDRNQGEVESARARLTEAELEVERLELSIRSRLAVAFQEYRDLKLRVDTYRNEMLPRAARAYELYLEAFRRMAAAYPQALIAQRTLLQLQEEYDDALARLWGKVVEIQGMLIVP